MRTKTGLPRNAKIFAIYLKIRRTRQKLTQKELGKTSGVSPLTIMRIEKFQTAPSWDVACRLANCLSSLGVTAFVDHSSSLNHLLDPSGEIHWRGTFEDCRDLASVIGVAYSSSWKDLTKLGWRIVPVDD